MEHGAWSMGHAVVNIKKIRNLIGSNRKSQIANRKFLRPSDFRPSDLQTFRQCTVITDTFYNFKLNISRNASGRD